MLCANVIPSTFRKTGRLHEWISVTVPLNNPMHSLARLRPHSHLYMNFFFLLYFGLLYMFLVTENKAPRWRNFKTPFSRFNFKTPYSHWHHSPNQRIPFAVLRVLWMWTIMADDRFVTLWSGGTNHTANGDFWIRPKCNISSSSLSSSGHTYESVCLL